MYGNIYIYKDNEVNKNNFNKRNNEVKQNANFAILLSRRE